MDSTPQTIDLSKVFSSLFTVISKNFKIILLSFLMCIGVAEVFHFLSPRVFESKMIIQSDILSESYALKVADNLNLHIKDEDIDFLSVALNLSKEDAGKLREFKVVSALTPMSQQMPEKEKIILVIIVRVADNAILPKLQEGIIFYLTSNPYIQKRVLEEKRKLSGLIAALDGELQKLDSLKRKITNGRFSSAKIGDVSIMDVSGLYGVSANLYDKRFEYQEDLALVDSIQVIEGLAAFKKPVWPKRSILWTFASLLAFLIIFLVLSWKTIRSQAE
ncbi:MAG: hypothetical protein K2U26_14355 [Cyclobacteriaceae bacterium]|nr:hypothetical protein [Cyclobacteriaceae bacterium]